jgi:hypothetical protein
LDKNDHPFRSSVRFHRPDDLVCPFLTPGCNFTRGRVFIVSARGKTPSAWTRGPSVRTRDCIRADAGPIHVDARKNYLFIFPIRVDTGCILADVEKYFIYLYFFHPRGRAYVLLFFLGGWKCKWGG